MEQKFQRVGKVFLKKTNVWVCHGDRCFTLRLLHVDIFVRNRKQKHLNCLIKHLENKARVVKNITCSRSNYVVKNSLSPRLSQRVREMSGKCYESKQLKECKCGQ